MDSISSSSEDSKQKRVEALLQLNDALIEGEGETSSASTTTSDSSKNKINPEYKRKLQRIVSFISAAPETSYTTIHPAVKKCINEKSSVLDFSGADLTAIPLSSKELVGAHKILKLVLRGNRLSSLPSWFPEVFPHVKSIDFANNNFSSLPALLAQMKSVEEINLSGNKLEFFPDELLRLPNLKKLNLSHNILVNIPNDINKFVSLEELDISANQLMNLPEEFSSIKTLKKLHAHGNPFLQSEVEAVAKILSAYGSSQTSLALHDRSIAMVEGGSPKSPSSSSPTRFRPSEFVEILDDSTDKSVDNSPVSTLVPRSRSSAEDPGTYKEKSPQLQEEEVEEEIEEEVDDDSSAESKEPVDASNNKALTESPSQAPIQASLEAVRELLHNTRSALKSYLIKESPESKKLIDFWEQINYSYKQKQDPEERSIYARKLHAVFIKKGGSQQLTLDAHIVERLEIKIQDYLEAKVPLEADAFDECIQVVEESLCHPCTLYMNSSAFAIISLRTQMALTSLNDGSSAEQAEEAKRQEERLAQTERKKKKIIKKIIKKRIIHTPQESAMKEAERRKLQQVTLDRYNALREILDSEKRYVEFLNVLWKVYQTPILDEHDTKSKISVIPIEARKKMFPPTLQSIIELNRSLLATLDKRFSLYTSGENSQPETIFFAVIGDIFKEFAPKLKIYANYAAVYEESMDMIRKMKKKYLVFDAFLQAKKFSGESKGYDIGSLLIMPIQRVPRYLLLLKALFQKTEVDHPDYNVLVEAIEMIDEYACYQNQMIKDTNNMIKINQLAKELKMENLSSDHRFIYEGELKYFKPPDKYKKTKAFLFHDLLILQYTKGTGLLQKKVLCQYPLQTAYISSAANNSVSVIIDSNTKFEFVFDNNTEMLTWMFYFGQILAGDISLKKEQQRKSADDGMRPKRKSFGDLAKEFGAKLKSSASFHQANTSSQSSQGGTLKKLTPRASISAIFQLTKEFVKDVQQTTKQAPNKSKT